MTKIKEPRPNESYFGWEEDTITFIDEPVTRGGPKSGHYGHKGRPGKVGGSLPGRKGVTRPITVAPGKRLVSTPATDDGELVLMGARRWIVLTDEEIEAIRGRSKMETNRIAWEQTLNDIPTAASAEGRIENHVQSLEQFLPALRKYVEQVRPRGGWTHALRTTVGSLERAIDAYREDGDAEHLNRFWQNEGGILKVLMYEGDEEHGMSRQGRQDSELYQIMREMDDNFDALEAGHFTSPIVAYYHVDAMSGGYEYNRKQLLAEVEGIENSERWTGAIRRNTEIYEARGDAFIDAADSIAFELGPYEERRERIETERATLLIENSKLGQRLERLTSEIDTIIQAGGPSHEVLAQTRPLQEARSELHDGITRTNDLMSDLVDEEYERREQMREALIGQLRYLNPEIGQGDIYTSSLRFQDGNWLGMGFDVIGDDTYWGLLRETDSERFNTESARAVDMAYEQYEDKLLPNIKDGLEFMHAILPRDLKPDVELSIQHDGDDDLRAHYVSGSDLVELERYDGVKTVIHEMGHWIEDNNERLENAAVGFLLTQGGDHPIRPLSEITDNESYDPWEVAYDGAFERDYSGKVYYNPSTDDYKATEVVSMGLEQLYTDPVQFARTDPEHYTFMIALLSGQLLRD